MAGGNTAGLIAGLVISGVIAGTAGAGCITCHSDAEMLKKLVQPPKTTHAEGEG